MKQLYGLLGRNISYSFSREYFTRKFEQLGLTEHQYVNFDIAEISELPHILKREKESLRGFNVTIPYKQDVFTYLDDVAPDAQKIGAVNVVKVFADGHLEGYNTDVIGFENSLKPLLKLHHKKALILGTGGAAKAVAFVLGKLQIGYLFVSRNAGSSNSIRYDQLDEKILEEYTIIINTTPLGTFPETEKYPAIPYEFIHSGHLLYDLIYNPAETTFLKKGKEQGAVVKNGLEMLELQAEAAWEIWNS